MNTRDVDFALLLALVKYCVVQACKLLARRDWAEIVK